MADAEYDDVVDGTVDEVKQRVRAEDLDAEQVLQVERANKDRTTLTTWLEERVESGEPAAGASGTSLRDTVTGWQFLAGLLIGLIAAGAAFSAGIVDAPGGTASAAATADSIETYFAQNAEGIPLTGVSVQEMQRLEGSNLYRASMVLSAEFLNTTVEQNQTMFVTPGARYIFRSRPIDTTRPLSEQVGQGAQGSGGTGQEGS